MNKKALNRKIILKPGLYINTNLENELNMNNIAVLLQVISKELSFSKLIEKSLHIIMKKSNADRGIVIVNKNDMFTVEAIKNIFDPYIIKLNSIPLLDYHHLPYQLIQHVIDKKEHVVVKEPDDGDYFKSNNINVSLCLPVIHKHRLLSIFYLENSLRPNIYTFTKIKVLTLLSSQIAIAMKNALLHSHVMLKARENILVLKKKNIQLLKTNRKLKQTIKDLGDYDKESYFKKQCEKYKISPGEKKTIRLLIKGYLYKEIAFTLHLSVNTIKERVKNIYKKCHVQNKVELTNLFNKNR
jgi:DNA-binding CsgD family transcriptional regulator